MLLALLDRPGAARSATRSASSLNWTGFQEVRPSRKREDCLLRPDRLRPHCRDGTAALTNAHACCYNPLSILMYNPAFPQVSDWLGQPCCTHFAQKEAHLAGIRILQRLADSQIGVVVVQLRQNWSHRDCVRCVRVCVCVSAAQCDLHVCSPVCKVEV